MKKSLILSIAAATLASLTTFANAQTKAGVTSPGAMSQTSTTAATPLDAKGSAYLRDAASGSAYELQLSELGAEKASSGDVRGYASSLVLAHAAYTTSLMNLAHEKGLVLPTGADASDTMRLSGLAKQSGVAFDRAFLQEEVRVNTDDLSKSTTAMAATNDQALVGFLREFATGDRFHLSTAKQLLGASTALAPAR